MLSEMARLDLEALRKQGFKPTDEETIKLNDIALRIENGRESTPANHPRSAFAGNVLLEEPTIGALEWWLEYGSDAVSDSNYKAYVYFFMLANSRNLELLDKLHSPKDIKRAVKEWAKHVDATQSELWRAMFYVKFGEQGPSTSNEELIDNQRALDCMWATVIMAAGMFEVTPEKLRTVTMPTLTKMLYFSNIKAGRKMKQSVAEDYIKYQMLLKSIEDRGKDGK